MTLILETSSGRTALETLREKHELEPGSKLFMPLAEELRTRGEYGEAIKLCRRGKQLYPDYISCRVLLGKCLMELGMEEEALRELEKVLELDRENIVSLRVMAETSRARGRLGEATDYYRAALRINPSDADAQNRLAVLMSLQELPEAEDGEATEQRIQPYEDVRFDEPEKAATETIELNASGLAAKWEAFSLEQGLSEARARREVAEGEVRPGEPAVSEEVNPEVPAIAPAVMGEAQVPEPAQAGKDARRETEGVPVVNRTPVRPPVQFFDYQVRRSDFSVFAEWVSRVRQETCGPNESSQKEASGAGREAGGETEEGEHSDGQE
ncbi:MAG: tetratricopeptide repeat protein [Candidatus Eiseniibacteriota bacterium]|nr:MAG: tetratricopeptide repeat protein [Candidatus Eisenbacteria bacterium]